jgi:hypothetical protein
MAYATNFLIAESVNRTVKQFFPDKYYSLCHVFSIVGANVISIALQRNYRAVAGLAVIDCGNGVSIKLTDNAAFTNQAGGAFHCWIESTDDLPEQRQMIDFTFKHHMAYAAQNNIGWHKKHHPEFLWGLRDLLVVKAELDAVPAKFSNNQIWVCETQEGLDWMTRHLAENMSAYVGLTTHALQLLKYSMPKGQAIAW